MPRPLNPEDMTVAKTNDTLHVVIPGGRENVQKVADIGASLGLGPLLEGVKQRDPGQGHIR